jgi:hypothetical protein
MRGQAEGVCPWSFVNLPRQQLTSQVIRLAHFVNGVSQKDEIRVALSVGKPDAEAFEK